MLKTRVRKNHFKIGLENLKPKALKLGGLHLESGPPFIKECHDETSLEIPEHKTSPILLGLITHIMGPIRSYLADRTKDQSQIVLVHE